MLYYYDCNIDHCTGQFTDDCTGHYTLRRSIELSLSISFFNSPKIEGRPLRYENIVFLAPIKVECDIQQFCRSKVKVWTIK